MTMAHSAIARTLRFAIAAILLGTAAGKLLDVTGFAAVLETYRAFPTRVLMPLAVAIPAAELLLAAWLFSGWKLSAAAVGSAGIHLAYAAWSAVTILRGLRLANCGCFGATLKRPLGWSTVAEDLGLVAASVLLFFLSLRETAGVREMTTVSE